MGKNVTRSTRTVRPSREARRRHRHHPAAQMLAAKPSTRTGYNRGAGGKSRPGSLQSSSAAGERGGHTHDMDLHRRGLWYGWTQNSQRTKPPLDAVVLDDLSQRFTIGKKSAAAVGRHACTSEYCRVWHRQRRPGRGLIEPRLGGTELAPAGGCA